MVIYMDYKKLSRGLGVFSLALAATEVFGAKRITRALDAEGHEGLVRGFGAREAAAGVAILTAPAAATNIWARVAGDLLDLGTLGLAARNSPRNKAVWGAIAFVVGATVLDALVAVGLDNETGKTLPVRREPAAA